MNRTEIINLLINKNNYKSYLEIGLDDPDYNFNKIKCQFKESCDPYIDIIWDKSYGKNELPENVKKVLTYRLTSDEMFKINNKKYDIIFIDGYHEQMQVGRDIINALKHLNKNGIILVHDCLPPNEECQIMPRQCGFWTGDVWKAIPKLKKQNINYYTINADNVGLGLILYKENSENLYYFDELSNLTWNDFVKNKNELMNIISEDDFLNIF